MTTERAQAEPQAVEAAARGSDQGQQPKPSRVQEFVSSLTDPTEVAEFRKLTRALLEPDFQALDKTHQRRLSAAEKRLKDAEAAMQELADPDILSRYQQEKGSLEKAKERAMKNGLPAYMARHIRTFDDLWEAEDDYNKNSKARAPGAAATDGESAGADGEDAAFSERMKALGYVRARRAGAAGEPTVGNIGGAPVNHTAQSAWDAYQRAYASRDQMAMDAALAEYQKATQRPMAPLR